MRVQVSPAAQIKGIIVKMDTVAKTDLAYIVGVALGDGNLSKPNERATRLRVTCDTKYTEVAKEIFNALVRIFPKNKVSYVKGPKDTYFNISVYSNTLNTYIPWKVGRGSKYKQNAHVPLWIKESPDYIRACLRGLIQSDGSIYSDRGYKMVNFTNHTPDLAQDVKEMMETLSYEPRIYRNQKAGKNPKYTVRLSRNVSEFITEVGLRKS